MQIRKLKTLALTFIITTFSISSYATGPGFYMGFAFGPATNDGGPTQAQVMNKTKLQVTTINPRSKQFGSRLYMGDQFNDYAAFELGFTFFNAIGYSNPSNLNLCSSPTVRVRDVELLGKGTFPFGPYFDAFAKAGIAVAYTTLSGPLIPTFNPKKHQTCGKAAYSTKYDPVFAFGATYDINQRWVTDITYSVLLTGGKPNRMTFIGIGLAYHFTPVYCGQFLCDT